MFLTNLLTVFSSLVMLNSSHPLMMVMAVIGASCLITSSIFLMIGSSWFSYILVLTFLGGILVLFIYIASLIPNEMISSSKKIWFIIPVTALMITFKHPNSMETSTKILLTYTFMWNLILTMIIIILVSMIFISIMSYNPFSPLKTK